jgi:hypothetical protein
MGWMDAELSKGPTCRTITQYSAYRRNKAERGLRRVLDFRRLNLKTMDSKYSIHCIDQCLDTKWKAEDGLPKCSKEACI